MAKTLCQFVGEDGPAHPELWLPGPPKDVVLTPVREEVNITARDRATALRLKTDQWRLKTVMPKGDDYIALYQHDRRWG